MEDAEFEVFIISVAAGLSLQLADFSVHHLQFTGADAMFMPIQDKGLRWLYDRWKNFKTTYWSIKPCLFLATHQLICRKNLINKGETFANQYTVYVPKWREECTKRCCYALFFSIYLTLA